MPVFEYYCAGKYCAQLCPALDHEEFAITYKGCRLRDEDPHTHYCRIESKEKQATRGVPIVEADGSVVFMIHGIRAKFLFPKGTLEPAVGQGHILKRATLCSEAGKRVLRFYTKETPLITINDIHAELIEKDKPEQQLLRGECGHDGASSETEDHFHGRYESRNAKKLPGGDINPSNPHPGGGDTGGEHSMEIERLEEVEEVEGIFEEEGGSRESEPDKLCRCRSKHKYGGECPRTYGVHY